MTQHAKESPKTYRLYVLDKRFCIRRGQWVQCLDDTAAIEMAKAALIDTPVEVWEGTRVVIRLAPDEMMRKNHCIR